MTQPGGAPLVTVSHVWLRAGVQAPLRDVSVDVYPRETLVIVGANGSGKTILTRIIAGRLTPHQGSVSFHGITDPPAEIHLVSFDEQAAITAEQRRTDLSWIMHGKTDEGSRVVDFVGGGKQAEKTLTEFGIAHLRNRGLRFLSSGEWRRTILARAALHHPKIVVYDDPYDGLDTATRGALKNTLNRPLVGDSARIVAVGRSRDIPDNANRIVELCNGEIVSTYSVRSYRAAHKSHDREVPKKRLPDLQIAPHNPPPAPEELIRMEEVSVAYGERQILNDIAWRVHSGETWHILGPNGAGKSTLLSLIDGSNTKAYGQKIWLFGRKRGSGESVTEIRKQIGLVSPALHNLYPLRTTALEAIVSGFHDSAGLYEAPSGLELAVARHWLGVLGLSGRERARLRELSFGEQRAVLVARAMVKSPPILIADEPGQGLDQDRSEFVVQIIDSIAQQTETCVLYVSHDPDQTLRSTTHRMTIQPATDGSSVAVEAVAAT